MDEVQTILVIDDEDIIRRSFCDQLEDLGYGVLEAVNGKDGIAVLKNQHPDLILTDLRMPEMGGLEVVKHSKALAPGVPIIVISGAGLMSDAIDALRLGADDYLIKPISDLAQLQHTVEKALEKTLLVKENRRYQNNLEELVQVRTEELEQANLQMRSMQKMDALGQLTSGIAHDFNNILNVILGNVELMQQQITEPNKYTKRLEKIQKSIARGATLVAQLLSFSSRDAAISKSLNINQIIGDMDSLIGRPLTDQITVMHNLANELWLTDIDPGDFEGALLNLLINAYDAMPDGGRITITTCNCELTETFCRLHPGAAAGKYVELNVSDTGEGMSSKILERLFEPFFTTKQDGKGTGLGLAMVYGFVQRSSGYITVHSELKAGATFVMYLPKAEAH